MEFGLKFAHEMSIHLHECARLCVVIGDEAGWRQYYPEALEWRGLYNLLLNTDKVATA